MQTEKKILVIGFAIYTVLTAVYFFQPSNVEENDVVPFNDRKGISKTLLGPRFVGFWTSNSTGELLFHKKGKVKASFVQFETIEFDQTFDLRLESNLYLNLHVMDPEFRDDRFIRIFQPLQTINATEYAVLKEQDEQPKTVNVWSFTGFNDLQESYNISFTGKIKFNPDLYDKNGVNKTAILENEDVLTINLIDSAPNGLNIEIKLNYDVSDRFAKSLLYTYFLIAIAFVNYYSAMNIFEKINESTNYTRRLNQTTVIVICLQDCFIFLYNIQLGFNYLDTWNYIFVILVYFVLFCFVDYRMLLYIWRYQDPRIFDEMSEYQFRNKLYMFQMKIYFYIICYIYFMWKYFIDIDLVVINSLLLVPQIVHHISSSDPPYFETDFLVSFTSIKYVIFIYLRGCPSNILEIRSYQVLPYVGLGIILLSLIILYQQENWGSKFFIPKMFKKGQYDYFVEMKFASKKNPENAEHSRLSENTTEENCCSICLTELNKNSGKNNSLNNDADDIKNKVLRRIIKKKESHYLMIAPCKHMFHAQCLGKWMEIKMDCPQCRQPLPPIM
jgi:hypothetical protein